MKQEKPQIKETLTLIFFKSDNNDQLTNDYNDSNRDRTTPKQILRTIEQKLNPLNIPKIGDKTTIRTKQITQIKQRKNPIAFSDIPIVEPDREDPTRKP
jgi:hypothetical protein